MSWPEVKFLRGSLSSLLPVCSCPHGALTKSLWESRSPEVKLFFSHSESQTKVINVSKQCLSQRTGDTYSGHAHLNLSVAVDCCVDGIPLGQQPALVLQLTDWALLLFLPRSTSPGNLTYFWWGAIPNPKNLRARKRVPRGVILHRTIHVLKKKHAWNGR